MRHTSPVTYTSKMDAEAWSSTNRRKISRHPDAPRPPASSGGRGFCCPDPQRLRPAVARWATDQGAARSHGPATTTNGSSRPDRARLGARSLEEITPAVVRAWYGHQDAKAPTMRAHAYALLRTIWAARWRPHSSRRTPARSRAGSTRTPSTGLARPPCRAVRIVNALPEKYRLLVLAAWCAFRYGELAELRRSDLTWDDGDPCAPRVVRMPGRRLLDAEVARASASLRSRRTSPAIERHRQSTARPAATGLLFPRDGREPLPPLY